MAKNITPRAKNYNQWYLDVIQAAKLADYAPVKGCMVIRPTGFAIWERMQQVLDRKFKESGHENAYFPLLIPQSFLQREAQHVQGFSPELAVVTHAGGHELEEPLVVRPTSETMIGYMYARWIQSYRDLPLRINQWCNIMRWELRTRLFLRTSEFLWQEGHTAHETDAEAEEETQNILALYRNFFHDYLAMPVIAGRKSEAEKFPGALCTYSVEAMMQDRRALQAGTAHHLGQNFARAFEIRYLDRENQQQYAHTTSWGVSTRMIGGLLMTHSDDDGLVLPPRIAPLQVIIIPLGQDEAAQKRTHEQAQMLQRRFAEHFDPLCVRVDTNFSQRPAERFFHWIQQGVPLRVELGLRDLDQDQVILVRRDTREKRSVATSQAATESAAMLEAMQQDLYTAAERMLRENSFLADDYASLQRLMAERKGFVWAHWNGSEALEQRVQKETHATIRCIPLEEEYARVLPAGGEGAGRCILSGEPSSRRVLFAQAY